MHLAMGSPSLPDEWRVACEAGLPSSARAADFVAFGVRVRAAGVLRHRLARGAPAVAGSVRRAARAHRVDEHRAGVEAARLREAGVRGVDGLVRRSGHPAGRPAGDRGRPRALRVVRLPRPRRRDDGVARSRCASPACPAADASPQRAILAAARVSTRCSACASSSPAATRTRRVSPAVTSFGSRTTAPDASCTTAYPRSRVAFGDSARTRARVWSRSCPARSRAALMHRRLRSRSPRTSPSRVDTNVPGSARTGRLRIASSRVTSRCTMPTATRRARLRSCMDPRYLLGVVGHDPLAGIGRRGAADVRDARRPAGCRARDRSR